MTTHTPSICFVNPISIFGEIGGAEVQIFLLATESIRRGWKVTYVTMPDQIPDKDDSGIQFIPFLESGNLQKNKNTLSKILTAVDADVYYQRERKLWTWYTGEFAKQSGKTFIYAASMDIDCKKHKFLFRRTGSVREYYKNIKLLKPDWELDKLTLQGIRHATFHLTQTERQKSLLMKNLGIKSVVFPNIHPVPADHEITKTDPPIVLWLASVKPWKQPEIFLKLANDLSTLNCRFILAGQLADQRHRKEIETAENTLKNFSYIRDVPFEKSNQLLAKASLFINTSRMQEGFPNTYVQAWLRRTPTVALNFDPDGVIEREQLGTKAGSYPALREIVVRYINNRDLRFSTGERTRQYAISAHGLQENADRFFMIATDQIS